MARQIIKNLTPKIGATEEYGVARPFLGGVLTGTGEGTSSWISPAATGIDETSHQGINHQDVEGVPSYTFVGVYSTEEQFFVGVISTFGDDPTPDGAYGFVGSAGAYTKYLYLNGVWETYEVHGEFDWDTDAATPYKTAHDATDHAGLTGIPSIAGLLDETAHDALDHTGLTGVGGGSEYFNDPVADYANLPAVDNDDGDVRVALDSHKMYVWDADAATPYWREAFTVVTTNNITVDPSSWRYFTVNLIDTAVADFKCLIAKVKITAIDGNATPDMSYGIDLFTDSGRSVYAYAASDITSVIYEDRVPFIWEGSNVIYGRMTNAKAAGITDCDVEITWMV